MAAPAPTEARGESFNSLAGVDLAPAPQWQPGGPEMVQKVALEPVVASVPEPESGPMMLAGVGLMLLLASRRTIGRR